MFLPEEIFTLNSLVNWAWLYSLLLKCFWIAREGEVLVLGMFVKIRLWSHPVQGFFLLGGVFCLFVCLLITTSISLVVHHLFNFPVSSWFSFRRVYMFLDVYSFLLDCPLWWHIVVRNSFFCYLHTLNTDIIISVSSYQWVDDQCPLCVNNTYCAWVSQHSRTDTVVFRKASSWG